LIIVATSCVGFDGTDGRQVRAVKWGKNGVTAASEPHYRAFISYSHADSAVATWLHRALESYHVPANLIGKETAIGPVPRRLTPIFRDRDELAASGDLSAGLKDALAAAQFLIVIASPAAAKSVWVNEEVRTFKQVHGEGRVLTVIAEGEPGGGDAECFPPAVAFRVGRDGVISTERAEPIAADLRPDGDGKRLAKLKLIAGLTGLKLDDLVQREAARRQARMMWLAVAASVLALVMTGLTVVAVRARGEAEHQRAEADGLVEFMLTDLRKKLEPVGRLDALDVVGQRALKYYGEQNPGSLDADALGRRSRALHLVGEVSNIRGDSAAGLTAFRQAAATTGELLTRDPDNQQRIFDHAQSVFWVGAVAYERGELKVAEAQWREYKRLADRLVFLGPKNPAWQMEVSYAETNLGILFYGQGRYAEAEPAFSVGLQKVENVAAGEPWTASRQQEIGAAINWLGKARAALNQTDEAERLHRREIAINQTVLKSDPANNQAKMHIAVAWQHLASIALIKGNVQAALSAANNSLTIMAQLKAIEPENTEWQETSTRAQLVQADNYFYGGSVRDSEAMNAASRRSINQLVAADPRNTTWSVDLRSWQEWQQARLALHQGRAADALSILDAITRRFAAAKSSRTADRAQFEWNVSLATGDALARLGRREAALALWQQTLREFGTSPTVRPIRAMRAQFMLLNRLGREAEARAVADELDRQGDKSPAYLLEKQASR
jgi:MTH538 TIR-like domain (DUF1863)